MHSRSALILAWLQGAISVALPSVRDTDSIAGADIKVDWRHVVAKSKTTNTLQEVVMPPLLANSSIRDEAMRSLSLVSADYVRFVPWFPYPELAVPEITAPVITNTSCTTSWNMTYADQFLGDFLRATPGKKHIINFSTTPDWMWLDNGGATYPTDVNVPDFNYNQGTQLRDPSLKELTDYYQRLISWYVNGGFTDECGVYHHSGYHWDFEFWEILNESQAEHDFTPEFYNQVYDAMTKAIREVAPHIGFVGGALAYRNATWVRDFLDKDQHAPGTPLEWFSYHYYAGATANETTQAEAAVSFQQTDVFLEQVVQFNEIRARLNPDVKITIDEIGTMDPLATTTVVPNYTIPAEYWVWSGGIFAYIFAKASPLGIEGLGESQLLGYPGQFESVSMLDYKTGKPNARLRVLQLLQHSFGPGDLVLGTTVGNETAYHAQAFETTSGARKLLLVNKLDQKQSLRVDGFTRGLAQIVDLSTAGNMYRTEFAEGEMIELTPYATMVLAEV